jgi:hypothetical protein
MRFLIFAAFIAEVYWSSTSLRTLKHDLAQSRAETEYVKQQCVVLLKAGQH